MKRVLAVAVTAMFAGGALVGTGSFGLAPIDQASATMSDGPSGFTDRPGVAKDPVVLFHEDFESIDKTGPIVPLVDYTSAEGYAYEAEGPWADPYVSCNGFVTSPQNDMGTACNSSTGSQGGLLALVDVLGQVNGSDATQNAAVAAYTSGPAYAPDLVVFQTDGEVIPLPNPNRFMTFSVNAAAVSCHAAQPSFTFSVLANGVETPIPGLGAINPCTDDRAQVYAPTAAPDNFVFYAGEFAAGGSFLSDGTPVGIVMRNGSGATAGNDAAFDDIKLMDVTPHLNKEFTPERVPFGGTTTLTFTVTNTSELAAKDGWAFTDTLRAGLEIAADPNVGGSCAADVEAVAGSNVIRATAGQLANGETDCTITVDVVAPALNSATSTPQTFINNADDMSNVIGLDATNETPVEFYSEPLLSISKLSSAGDNSAVGSQIDYAVIVENVGTGDFSAGQTDPVYQLARITDDLSDVLDDAELDLSLLRAEVDGVGVAAPTYDPVTHELSWAGELAVGQKVTLMYTVTLIRGTAEANGAVLNTACVLEDVAAAEPCATTQTLLPALDIEKTAEFTPGVNGSGDVAYTVTVTNPGPGDWTADNPAIVTDDLSGVLDEAWLDAATLTATIDGVVVAAPDFDAASAQLRWTGALASGETLELNYSGVYRGGADNLLVNTACVPDDAPYVGVDNCATAEVPGPALEIAKFADGSDTPLAAGSTVEYTLEFASTGQAAVVVDYVDYLDGILDDADVTIEPGAGVGDLVATRIDGVITITGDIPAGETYTVVYTVTIKDDAARGDSHLLNFLVPTGSDVPSEDPDNCAVTEYTNGVEAMTCNPIPPTPVDPVVPVKPVTPGGLAATGVEFGPALWLALLLALGGGAFALVSVYRRENQES